ncbi:PDZ domain-containing protein 11 isoform X1 [Pipra filicauda]|uniref:PDZ domain-containing protein 11 isoform X1 n=1 Tax=Pipra filicauda TaxID=649802 RepID=A0A7R5K3W2_9PASS|nr:PDZ domain-containing protein 11 isoform X1 [Pipra filicauda]XP_039234100.1 PDZ domain-containing protein 11 isoform X1 [Pipra filicauda]
MGARCAPPEPAAMEPRAPYDDFPVVFLPPYESPPAWVPPHERVFHPDYNNELTRFLPRTIALQKPPGAQLGFNIRGGKASQLGIFISKVCPSLSVPPGSSSGWGFPHSAPPVALPSPFPAPGIAGAEPSLLPVLPGAPWVLRVPWEGRCPARAIPVPR